MFYEELAHEATCLFSCLLIIFIFMFAFGCLPNEGSCSSVKQVALSLYEIRRLRAREASCSLCRSVERIRCKSSLKYSLIVL